MGANITYMGTKRALAPAVAEVLGRAQTGTMLDAFSGMCSVGESVGTSRQIWNNDIQVFASDVAKAVFASRDLPLTALSCGDIHHDRFKRQRDILRKAFSDSLAAESELIQASSYPAFQAKKKTFDQTLGRDLTRCRVRSPHLFATTYSGSFFGIAQAIDADAIVSAMRTAIAARKTTTDEMRWCRIALGRALLKIANSPGHFAQYLKPKATTYRRHIALRRRALWSEWLTSLSAMSPVGEPRWRKLNKVFNQDSLILIPRLAREKADVSVIYADPPYTDDQYSRFYHVLETLCLYDYPEVTGVGLYRPGRFHTPFSRKATAVPALLKLITVSAQTGADLVLSYPTNGLVNKAGGNIRGMLRKHFKRVELCRSVAHHHSTFGASKGTAQAATTELIFLARTT